MGGLQSEIKNQGLGIGIRDNKNPFVITECRIQMISATSYHLLERAKTVKFPAKQLTNHESKRVILREMLQV